MANNITVWINKFISNLNIHIAAPIQALPPSKPETFLPVKDYISITSEELAEEDEDWSDYEVEDHMGVEWQSEEREGYGDGDGDKFDGVYKEQKKESRDEEEEDVIGA